MTTQTEAERLAEIMSQMAKRQKNELGDYWSPVWCEKAAAELRRLASFNNDLLDEVARLKSILHQECLLRKFNKENP